MPRLGDAEDALLRSGQEISQSARRNWNAFSDFALRDNVLEIAVGLIIASAFTAIVKSFINNILLPPISLIPFIDKNLDEKFSVLRGGAHQGSDGYNTSKQALDDGAIIMVWGDTLSKALNFIGLALTLFMVARAYEISAGDRVIKRTVKCKYCRKRISEKAKRCVNCTSWMDGREDRD